MVMPTSTQVILSAKSNTSASVRNACRTKYPNIGMNIHGYESNTSWEQQTSPERTRSEQMCWCWEIAKESI